MKTIVSMNDQGRLTVPAAARHALRVEGPVQFELEVVDDTLILRPAVVIPREDLWAYTPEHLERLERALQDAAEGRVQEGLTEGDLMRMAADAS